MSDAFFNAMRKTNTQMGGGFVKPGAFEVPKEAYDADTILQNQPDNVKAYALPQFKEPEPVAETAPEPEPTFETGNADIERTNTSMQRWLDHLTKAHEGRVDAIQQGTIAQMRGAATMAAQAGQSFGGSFADAQRQVGIAGQDALRDEQIRFNEAMRDPLATENAQAFQRDMTDLGYRRDDFVFDRNVRRDDEVFARDAARQDDLIAGDRAFQTDWRDDERRRQDDIRAGEVEQELLSELEQELADSGANSFADMDFSDISRTNQRTIEQLADAAGMSPEEYFERELGDFEVSAGTQRQQEQDRRALRQSLVEQDNDARRMFEALEEGDWSRVRKEYYQAVGDGVNPDDLRSFLPSWLEV